MKNFSAMAVTAAAMLMASCGATKQTTKTDYQQQWQQTQQSVQQNAQQSVQQRPARTVRTVDPCIELANADSENVRAYGTATSYVEKVALNEAARDARNQLAQMMKVAVEGAAQDYESNAAENLKSSAQSLGQSIMTQFVAEEVSNTRIIKTSIYDLADGSVQVYVCIEMRTNKADMAQKLDNVLDREGIIGIQYDRERFIQKMADGLEEYKRKNRE